MPYITRRKVRFQHCDPAAIVFYPRYFEMINSVVEDFFAEVVEVDFRAMHVERHVGVPTVSLETRFHAPSRLGDELEFNLVPTAVGSTSLTLSIHARCEDETRLSCRLTLVFVDMDSGRPIPWPDAMRQRLVTELS
ncbi:4-hydroxybenzoyl-CoA thioesterase [Litchfieldella qijiaojingensis]|uniref:4-hydroxybenzoyl-CoA thioesterase n=1 Tax=Litchfieldella qijiaojingensis TaxID=980347 RepID=A0ABQ2YUS9_9GAMM|nr:thioesterase family protein [Halomonas qijiaojingensis]GGX93897.1 4-hydroxybenzoyl-CoA thioesterase [Halomonas qijiaojingensis]